MRPFLDTIPGDDLQGTDLRYKLLKNYIEFELKMSDDFYIVFYLLPKNSSSVFVASCWQHTFDQLLDRIEDAGDLDLLDLTHPTLAQLIANGFNDEYGEGALVRLHDGDTGEPKWFLVSVSQGAGFSQLDELFEWPTHAASRLVIRRSMGLLKELCAQHPMPDLMDGAPEAAALPC